MSKARSLKYMQSTLTEAVTRLEEGEEIARVIGSRGATHEVEFGDGVQGLCTLPAKFRNKVWIKRGDYVVVSVEEGEQQGDELLQGKEEGERQERGEEQHRRGEVMHVLYANSIKQLKKSGMWPREFCTEEELQNECKRGIEGKSEEEMASGGGGKSKLVTYDYLGDSDNDDDLFVNTNRAGFYESSSSEED
eukprot:Nk52_evm4s247 gene=Nk52_evmTU4s247